MKYRATVVSTMVCLFTMSGCERESLPWVCPEMAVGSLVVSEIRGPQSDDIDGYGQWIELYNAGDATLDLEGLHVSVSKLDGSGAAELLVRTSGVTVAPSEYVVLGNASPGAEPAHVDYGYVSDFDGNLYDTAAIDVIACGVLVDRAIYRNLPNTGTWTLDGTDPPNADENDRETAWCVDDLVDIDTPVSGVRGTPGQANLECPP